MSGKERQRDEKTPPFFFVCFFIIPKAAAADRGKKTSLPRRLSENNRSHLHVFFSFLALICTRFGVQREKKKTSKKFKKNTKKMKKKSTSKKVGPFLFPRHETSPPCFLSFFYLRRKDEGNTSTMNETMDQLIEKSRSKMMVKEGRARGMKKVQAVRRKTKRFLSFNKPEAPWRGRRRPRPQSGPRRGRGSLFFLLEG